ncbi:MAG TPA: peptidase M28 family protein, partial [Panacibacter sp.]|nr:peptidase M28 family protein [Panacibacter sp.]
MKKILLTAIIIPSILFGQDRYQSGLGDSAFIKMISDNILVSRASYNNLYALTKTVGGRLAGSPQMVKAEAWGYKTIQEAGADKISLQECMVPHWIRGGKDEAFVTYKSAGGKKENMQLNILALGNSAGSGVKGVEAPVVRVKDFDELEKRKDELKGKIVFYSVPFEETFVQTFQAYGKNVVYRAIGASRAAKYGAVAVLVRSMTHATDNNPHTGALHYL